MTYESVAARTVLLGAALPAHDQVFDLTGAIASKCTELRDYIAAVRSDTQAELAVRELLAALATA